MAYPAEHSWWWFRVVDPNLDTSWVAVDSGTNNVSISPTTMNGAGSWYLYLVNFKNFLSPVGSTSLAGLNVEQINKCLSRADCSLKGFLNNVHKIIPCHSFCWFEFQQELTSFWLEYRVFLHFHQLSVLIECESFELCLLCELEIYWNYRWRVQRQKLKCLDSGFQKLINVS